MNKSDTQNLIYFLIATIVMLVLGIIGMPYGFYTLIRIAVCILSIFLFVIHKESGDPILPVIYLVTAILFNPIIKVHLDKEIWSFIDGSVIFLFLISISKVKRLAVEENKKS